MNRILHRSAIAVTMILVTVTATAGSLDVVPAEEVGMSSERLARIPDHFQRFVEQKRSAGFQIIVSRRGKVVMHENIGLADSSTDDAIDDDTLFRIYSMTKPVVGVGMMILYEEGRFAMSDPIAKFIPEFEGIKVYAGEDEQGNIILEDAIRPPTMHDLFQHTAGFTYGIFGDTAVDKLYRASGLTDYDAKLPDLIARLAEIPLLYQPGTQYVYSVSVDVQGYIIELMTGMDAGEFVQERILQPLGMDETMAWVPPAEAHRFATVHTHDEEGKLIAYNDEMFPDLGVNNYLRKPGFFSGGSQLISTGDDYWRFAQMLLNGGEFNGVRILARPTVEMMTSNRLPESIPDRRISPGLGWGINMSVVTDPTLIDAPKSIGEYRHGGLATTMFYVDPVEEVIVIMLSQYLPMATGAYEDLLHRLVKAAIVD